MVVEFPKGPLNGSWDRVQKVIGPYGTSVNVISIEDILIDRAFGIKFWNDSDEWVKYIMVGNFDQIDWAYLKKRIQDLQCDVIQSSKEWAIISEAYLCEIRPRNNNYFYNPNK